MSRAQLTSTVEQNTGGAVSPFVAGKNKIINGDFAAAQRGNSFSNPTAGSYNLDRFFWAGDGSGATRTVSQQTFVPGTGYASGDSLTPSAPVGFYGTNFWRMAQTVAGSGGTYQGIAQRIENVQTTANQTITFSFWIKASGSLNVQAQYGQLFGSGGSSSVYAQSGSLAVTTSWQRLSWTFTLLSISGKTIGSGSSLEMYILFPVNAVQTIDITGVQLEAGSVATPFTTASGTLQGELALCQRYYQRLNGVQYSDVGFAAAIETTQANTYIYIPTMRSTPSCNFSGTLYLYINDVITYPSAYSVNGISPNGALIASTCTGLTRGQTGRATGNTTFYLEMSAEL